MNLILATDSYKLGHWKQYPAGTEAVHSYLEARVGATYPETVFFGLQPLLRPLTRRVTMSDVNEAAALARFHFGTNDLFNREGWEHIVREHGGRLPLRIRAVPEGSVIPTGNVLMTVENTDPRAYWLTNAMESYLMHVWYPTTVASRSRSIKKMLGHKLQAAGSPLDGLPFMLHDFGYRGATTHDAAEIGGAAHLVNFVGTDTVPALQFARREYGADYATLGFSVAATEHSVMTSLGREGEHAIVDYLIRDHPTGILSVVADSYNIYEFVNYVCEQAKDAIMARDGVFVVRPDSITKEHPLPDLLMSWILKRLWDAYGGTTTPKGFKVLDPHVRVLWGDGIDDHGIEQIVDRALIWGFSPENLVFGMGGGLLQKLNRDTQRFAIKASAIKRDGEWHDVSKQPLDASKGSKKGRLMLLRSRDGEFKTTRIAGYGAGYESMLQTVYEDGRMPTVTSFDEIRERAAL